MKHFIVFSLSLLLFSCASVTRYEPKNNSDSLIIGKIKMDNKNFNTYGSISVNGVHTANIEISISNMTSGEILKTKTDKEGFFMFYNLDPSDNYQITKIYLKKEENNSWADVYMNTSNSNIFSPTINSITDIGFYYVKTDKINNIWNFNKIDNSKFNDFIIKYKDTEWVNKNIIVNN